MFHFRQINYGIKFDEKWNSNTMEAVYLKMDYLKFWIDDFGR